MTREEAEQLLREELGELDEDDLEVARANAEFEETYEKMMLLL